VKPFVVAIDGPAGAGKSTTARGVAQRLGLLHVDSGAMYRIAAWLATRERIPLEDEARIVALVSAARFEPSSDGMRVNGADVGDLIRTAEAGEAASRVAVLPGLRRRLVAVQRSFARPPGLVIEGRDIGTVVFPDADLKLFVSASPESRAERRSLELRAKGQDPGREAVLEATRERDRRDTERDVSPLSRAPDAILLDTTRLQPDEQVDLAAHWASLARAHPDRPGINYTIGKSVVQAFAHAFLDFHPERAHSVPRNGPVIVACNHISFWDPPLVGAAIRREMHYIAKAELFHNPLFGRMLRSYNCIPIQRGTRARTGLKGAEEVLREGGGVVIFPEGTRNKSGSLIPARAGVARLAAVTRTPIVPAYISGSNRIRRSMLRQVPIRITFGSPVMPPRLESDREELRSFAQSVMEMIAALREEQGTTSWK